MDTLQRNHIKIHYTNIWKDGKGEWVERGGSHPGNVHTEGAKGENGQVKQILYKMSNWLNNSLVRIVTIMVL